MPAALAIAFTILAVALFVRRLIRWHFDPPNDGARQLAECEAVHLPFGGARNGLREGE